MDTAETDLLSKGHPSLQMSARRRWAVVIGVTIGHFIAALEVTIVGTAMPTVISSLGGLNHYSWVFSAYLLTSTVTVPIWGKLSDLYGRRLFFQIGLAIFILGSVLSGLSTSMTQLIAFRAVQGIGAGALVPLSMTIVGAVFELRERARMQAFFSGAWGLASVIGPLAGGFLTDQMSWRWVFYVNIPFGLLAGAIIGVALKEPKRTERPIIDYAGAIVLTASITTLMLFLVDGGGSLAALFKTRNLALLVAATLLMLIFVRIERRAKDPIVPFELFSDRMVTVSVITTFLAGVAMFGAISFVPLFAQGAMGATATAAGSLLTPLLLGWVICAIASSPLLLRIGYRPMTIAGCSFLTVGFIILSTFGPKTPRSGLMVAMAIIGAGLGSTMLTLIIAVQQSVPKSRLGVATSLNQFARSIGGAVGVAVMGAVLTTGLAAKLSQPSLTGEARLTPDRLAELIDNPSALVEPISRAAMPAHLLVPLENAFVAALRNVFRLAAVLAGIALFLVVIWLPHGDKVQKVNAVPPEGHTPATTKGTMLSELMTVDSDHPIMSGDKT
jgi:EmrB/QacA subfamily drug resistance transporter